jgi:hypothetical protein
MKQPIAMVAFVLVATSAHAANRDLTAQIGDVLAAESGCSLNLNHAALQRHIKEAARTTPRSRVTSSPTQSEDVRDEADSRVSASGVVHADAARHPAVGGA